jgi:signal transduction histidine kinase
MPNAFPTRAESRTPAVLVIDDERQLREVFSEALHEKGYHVETAEDGASALRQAHERRFDVAVCDLKMPGMGGLETLEKLRAVDPDLECIVMTAYGTLENAIQSIRIGVSDFLQKPIPLQDLVFSIEKALERRDLRERLGLYELSRSIFSTLDPDDLYGRILRSAIQVLRADDASLMLLDENRRLTIALSTSLQREIREGTQLALGERVAGRVALQGEPVVINETVAGDARFEGVLPMRDVRASIVCPLTMRDQLLGVLNINRVSVPERYTEHDRRNAMILSSLVALALGNARLHKELQASVRRIEDTQEELIQNEKMLALGSLLSGVAHELNNPLCGVLGYAQLLQRSNDDPKLRKGIEVIAREGERAAKIVSDLLIFARRETPQKKPLGLNGVVLKALERKAYDLKVCRIEVRADLDPKLPLVWGDFHQFQTVFGHLITNAQQSMFESHGQGILGIRSETRSGRVFLTISDDGRGIPPEHARRIFDPFFTTRAVGKGVGLGLSVCFAIVRDHGGVIKFTPGEGGRGATFVLEVPAAGPEAIAAGERSESGTRGEAGAPEAHAPGGPRILIADGEAHIQDLLVDLLGGMGFRVDTAETGEGVLAKIRSAEYDALIADYGMPPLGGQGLFEALVVERPALARRTIFLTNDSGSPALAEFAASSGSILIGKPFDLDTMRSALRRLFAAAPPGSATIH